MKKIYFLAALAATMLTGCMDDGSGTGDTGFGEDDPSTPMTSLSIRLSNMGGGRTRSLEGIGNVAVGTNRLSNAHVFILDETGTTVYDYAHVFGTTELDAITSTGWTFPNLIPEGSRVFILGNVNSDYNRTVRDLETLADINSFTSDIWTQVDYNYATMANVDGIPVPAAPAPGSASVSVEIKPVISRLELHNLEAGGNIDGFSVTGVYITDYYTAFTYGGGFPAGTTPVDNRAALATNGGMTGDNLQYPAIAQGSPLTAQMTGNRIWAYNVAAGSLPLLIIRLENVVVDGRREERPLYLTVSSYGNVTEFVAGRIYRIPTLSFTEEHLDLAPVADGSFEAELVEWDQDNLTPDINTPAASIAVTTTMGVPLTDWAATDTSTNTQSFDVNTTAAPATLTTWDVVINQGAVNYFTPTLNVLGGSFTIAPAAINTSVFPRLATVTVNGENSLGEVVGTSQPFQIRQQAATAEMANSPSPASITFDDTDDNSAGTAGDIEFDSNVAFTVTLEGADADHFTLTGDTTLATSPLAGIDTYTVNVVPVANNVGGSAALNVNVVIRNTDGRGVAPVTIPVTHSNI